MATNAYQWSLEGNQDRRVAEVHHVDQLTHVTTQIDALGRNFDVMQAKLMPCDFYSGNYPTHESQGKNQVASFLNHVNFVNNYNRQNNSYRNTYNPNWKNHPNFSWGQGNQVSQGKQPPPPRFQPHEKKSNLESMC